MSRCHRGQRRSNTMRGDWDRIDLRHGGDLTGFQQAASLRHVRLNYTERLFFQKWPVAVATIDVLPGRDGNARVIAHSDHSVDVIAGNRLLNPDQAEWL